MKNSIKLTTLATYLLFAAIGAYLGMEYQTLKARLVSRNCRS